MKCALAVAAGVLALVPANASAHSLVRVENGELRYISADAVSLNTLTIAAGPRGYRIADPTVEGGLDPGPCAPGRVDSDGFIREAFCPATRIKRIHADLGNQDDRARVTAPVGATILGGPGRDTLTGTAHDDVINGEDGDDAIDAGAGDDKLAGSTGDDQLDGADGADVIHGGAGKDAVDCGAGADRAVADAADDLAGCETLQTAAGDDSDLPPELVVKADRVAPHLLLGGSRRQRLRGPLVVLATSNELGTLRASAIVRIGRKRHRVPGVAAPVEIEGQGIDLEIALPARVVAAARRALAAGKRVNARVTVVAADREGNRTIPGIERLLTLTR